MGYCAYGAKYIITCCMAPHQSRAYFILNKEVKVCSATQFLLFSICLCSRQGTVLKTQIYSGEQLKVFGRETAFPILFYHKHNLDTEEEALNQWYRVAVNTSTCTHVDKYRACLGLHGQAGIWTCQVKAGICLCSTLEMPVEHLGHCGTAWCRYQCSKPFENFIGSDLWPRKAEVGQFIFTQSLSLPAPPCHRIFQKVFLQLCWCSCIELGWSIYPSCRGGSTEVNFHFIICVGNRTDGSAFTCGATGQIGQTDDTKEWRWRECIWREKKVKTTEEASSCRRKREK